MKSLNDAALRLKALRQQVGFVETRCAGNYGGQVLFIA
jgi:hypothetical protein